MPDYLAGWEQPRLQRPLQFSLIPVFGLMSGHYDCVTIEPVHLISHELRLLLCILQLPTHVQVTTCSA